jgi:hypothetical protein
MMVALFGGDVFGDGGFWWWCLVMVVVDVGVVCSWGKSGIVGCGEEKTTVSEAAAAMAAKSTR